jgi:hypothetical protein
VSLAKIYGAIFEKVFNVPDLQHGSDERTSQERLA